MVLVVLDLLCLETYLGSEVTRIMDEFCHSKVSIGSRGAIFI